MKVFDPKQAEQSVYEVQDGRGEWLTAAAHVLTTKKSPDPTSVLRLRVEDLPQFGIAVDPNQLGTTGITWVDYRHRNLQATADQLRELVQYLARECSQGQDLVRRIDKKSIEKTLRGLYDEPDCRCPPHMKRIARWVLKDTNSPAIDLGQIEQELFTIEFHDEIIRPKAYFMDQGDHLANWHAAVNLLRVEYAAHYLPAIRRRFGLH
jgi:hypothetical protein